MTRENLTDIDLALKAIDNAKAKEGLMHDKVSPDRGANTPAEEDIKRIELVVDVLNNAQKESPVDITGADCEVVAQKVVGAATNSIGNHGEVATDDAIIIEDDPDERIAAFNERLRKVTVGVCIAVSLFAGTLFADITLNDFKISNSINDSIQSLKTTISKYFDDLNRNKQTNDAVYMLDSYYNRKLVENGLATTISNLHDPFVIYENSVEDYKRLNANDVVDVYIYYRTLSEGEFAKFIKSVAYIDSDGNSCYYIDFEQFLRINGYPDVKTFENYAENIIYQLYQDGKIGYLGNGQMYFLDTNIQSVGRGGL